MSKSRVQILHQRFYVNKNHKFDFGGPYFEIKLRESGQYDVNNMIVALGVFTLRGGDEKGPGSIL